MAGGLVASGHFASTPDKAATLVNPIPPSPEQHLDNTLDCRTPSSDQQDLGMNTRTASRTGCPGFPSDCAPSRGERGIPSLDSLSSGRLPAS